MDLSDARALCYILNKVLGEDYCMWDDLIEELDHRFTGFSWDEKFIKGPDDPWDSCWKLQVTEK